MPKKGTMQRRHKIKSIADTLRQGLEVRADHPRYLQLSVWQTKGGKYLGSAESLGTDTETHFEFETPIDAAEWLVTRNEEDC